METSYKEKYEQALEVAKETYNKQPMYREWLEKMFSELKVSEDERIRKELMQNLKERFGTHGSMGGNLDMTRVLAWLEKQGEQKSSTEVKPKFKVGDWITNGIDVNKIIGIDLEDENYLFENGRKSDISLVESNSHRWTILDIKNGDILAEEAIEENYQYPFVAIYKECDFDFFNSYCFVGFDGNFYESEEGHTIENIHPATKEQRDLLFQKMYEAGYEWDSDSKQLLSLKAEPSGEQKLAELAKGEDYGIDGLYAAIDILQKTLGKVEGYQSDDGILAHKCAISAIKELSKQKPAVIIPKFRIGDEIKTSNEESLTITKIDEKGYWSKDLFICDFDEECLWDLVEQKPAETVKWSPQEESCICQLESLVKERWRQADKVHNSVIIKKMSELMFFLKTLNPNKKPQRIISAEVKEAMYDKPAGSEEDERIYNNLTDFESSLKHIMEEVIECGDTHNLKADADMLLRLVQKPAAWSEEDNKMSRFIGNAITVDDASIYLESKGIQVIDAHVWLNGLKDKVQPKQEWSEEDKNMVRYIGNAITCEESAKYLKEKGVDMIKAHCWLESFKPQPKQEWKQENTGDLTDFENAMMHIGSSFFGQHAGLDPNDTNAIKEQANLLLELVPSKEWSEEDSYYRNCIIQTIEEINNAPLKRLEDWEAYINWLKSLRPQNAYNPYKAVVESIGEMCKHYDKASHSGLRDFYDNVKVKCKDAKEYDKMFPQAHWKPSDEQLKVLHDAAIYIEHSMFPCRKGFLMKLYKQLKKLKEE